MGHPRGPVRSGVLLAGAAAVLFGMTAPLLKMASAGVGSIASSACLYLGAALGAGLMLLGRGTATRPRGRALGRLVAVAIVGAAVAPALLVRGLRQTDAATASLLLALEAPFTLMLARLFLREHIGGRVLLASSLIFAGGATLIGVRVGSATALVGAALVAGAAIGWAIDNIWSRALAESDPLMVVALKGLFGALAGGAAALIAGEGLPPAPNALGLLAVGAVGYGASLQLYLRAQTRIGAARTASVFAAAPFAGVVVAFALGAPWPGPSLPIAAALVLTGLWLHLSERHDHLHRHDPVEHEHWHRHDDGHHDHHHDVLPLGPHSHVHRHEATTHEHEHSEDAHHHHEH